MNAQYIEAYRRDGGALLVLRRPATLMADTVAHPRARGNAGVPPATARFLFTLALISLPGRRDGGAPTGSGSTNTVAHHECLASSHRLFNPALLVALLAPGYYLSGL